MSMYNWKYRLSNSKIYFARKCVSKLRSPLRMMNYIRRNSTELTRSVMSLTRAVMSLVRGQNKSWTLIQLVHIG